MFKKFKLAAITGMTAFLVACGGGGGGGGGSAGPVVSSSAFNILAVYINSFTTNAINPFTVSGTVNGYSVTGSGTATTGSVTSGTFESLPALQRTTTITGNISVNNVTSPLDSSIIDWTDNNYMPVGSSGGSEYTVVSGSAVLPVSAHVGDTGTVYTENRYTSNAKTTFLGTTTVTYVLEADTASTALLTLIFTKRNTVNALTYTGSTKFKITTNNTYTRISETISNPGGQVSLTLNF